MSREQFVQIQQSVRQTAPRERGLHQIIGEHALGFVNLAQACKQGNMQRMMDSWIDIDRCNQRWTDLIANGEHLDSPFRLVTSDLVQAYSRELQSSILHGQTTNSLQSVIDKESSFYSQLTGHSKDEIKSQWNAYVDSVGRMISIMNSHGPDTESFYTCATDCVRHGQLLGHWLNYKLYHKK